MKPKTTAKTKKDVPAFNPALRERDMLKQAKEDGCYGAKDFQRNEVPDVPSF